MNIFTNFHKFANKIVGKVIEYFSLNHNLLHTYIFPNWFYIMLVGSVDLFEFAQFVVILIMFCGITLYAIFF